MRLGYLFIIHLAWAFSLYHCIHATENIALNKQATQVGAYTKGLPQLAVDGNRTMRQGGCSEINTGSGVDPNYWWYVDLASDDPSQRFVVKNVTIYHYNGLPHRMDIYTGEESGWQRQRKCAILDLRAGRHDRNTACRPDRPVRYLTVTSFQRYTLCEVIVNGYVYQECAEGWWGEGCTNPCSSCEYACNDINGACKRRPTTITEVSPIIGPKSGGTEIMLRGYGLTRYRTVQVMMEALPCPVTLKNDTHLTCTTPKVDQSTVGLPRNLTVKFDKPGIILNVRQNFTYKDDPTVTKIEPTETIISGGVLLTVSGTGLDAVGKPVLEVTVLYMGTVIGTYQSVCMTVNENQLVCPTPPLEIMNENNTLSSTAFRSRSKRRSNKDVILQRPVPSEPHISVHRSRRQAEGGRFKINDGKTEIQIGFILDGVQGYRNLTETLPAYSKLNVYKDPQVSTWNHMQFVTSGRKFLEVEGRRLMTGIQASDYKMFIGNSSCVTLTVYTNRIICTAPDSTPALHPGDSSTGDIGVRIHIGIYLQPFFVGYVTYKTSSFFDDPKAKWSIIGGCIVLVLAVISIIAVRIKTSRKRRKQTEHPMLSLSEKAVKN